MESRLRTYESHVRKILYTFTFAINSLI
jgi:hypothetical protein